MFTAEFFTQSDESIQFSRSQGSLFAKSIAGDFNPLHDVDNSRFCIPGDLLFAVMLSKFGISKEMKFDFQGMVGGDMPIQFIADTDSIVAINDKSKTVLTVTRSGEKTQNEVFIEGLVRAYVAFSGKTFPHVIIGLMKDKGMMINTKRPMVIYDEMKISFDKFSDSIPQVEMNHCDFVVTGKRGMVTMYFDLRADGESIGKGEKKIIMSGLRPYQQLDIDYLVDTYNTARNSVSE